MRFLKNAHFKVQSYYFSLVMFHTVGANAYRHKIDGICRTNEILHFIISLKCYVRGDWLI